MQQQKSKSILAALVTNNVIVFRLAWLLEKDDMLITCHMLTLSSRIYPAMFSVDLPHVATHTRHWTFGARGVPIKTLESITELQFTIVHNTRWCFIFYDKCINNPRFSSEDFCYQINAKSPQTPAVRNWNVLS